MRKPIFENVSFLNEGLFDRFNTVELYGIYMTCDPNSKIRVNSVQGFKTVKELGEAFFGRYYEYKNGKYIVNHLDECPDIYI